MKKCCDNCTYGDNPFSNFSEKVLCTVEGKFKGKHRGVDYTCSSFEHRNTKKFIGTEKLKIDQNF